LLHALAAVAAVADFVTLIRRSASLLARPVAQAHPEAAHGTSSEVMALVKCRYTHIISDFVEEAA